MLWKDRAAGGWLEEVSWKSSLHIFFTRVRRVRTTIRGGDNRRGGTMWHGKPTQGDCLSSSLRVRVFLLNTSQCKQHMNSTSDSVSTLLLLQKLFHRHLSQITCRSVWFTNTHTTSHTLPHVHNCNKIAWKLLKACLTWYLTAWNCVQGRTQKLRLFMELCSLWYCKLVGVNDSSHHWLILVW